MDGPNRPHLRLGVVVGLVGLPLAAYVAVLLVGRGGTSPLELWAPIVVQWFPAAICWWVVRHHRAWDVLCATIAVNAYVAGNTYYYLTVVLTGALPPFPSPADIGYLSYAPLMLVAVGFAVRRHLGGVSRSVWLDTALGSLAAAAVLAVALSPILDAAGSGPWSPATVVALAWPLDDMVMLPAVVGVAASQGLRLGRQWFPLVAAVLVFATFDVLYALLVATDSYRTGTPLDAGWAVAVALSAVWVCSLARSDSPGARPAPTSIAGAPLVVPGIATVIGSCVLVLGTQRHVSVLAVVLAGATVLLGAARAQLAFRQLVRMTELRHQAATDDLTGLPNRRALYSDAAARLEAPGCRAQALLLLDLDKFKEVNDSLGHHVGDRLLVEVGARLREQLREGDLLARLGGDEFAILLEDADGGHARAVAEKLRRVLVEPVALEGISLRTDVSIGIALFPEHGQELSALLRRADIAMYKAKALRGGHHLYAGDDDTHGENRLRTLHELRAALAEEQLVLHYQPKIDLGTGRVCGVEALVRWDHPARGLLYPDAFLDIVEDGGMMPALTQAVLEQALDQAAAWRADGRELTVAVNLSASSLVDVDLPEQVTALLALRRLPPSALQLEITEEFLMTDRERARSILAHLRDRGVQIAVDDFGTGYSSLAYLRELPIDELKLDRSFVFPMADDARAASLVASTIALAHSLGLRMVAEGVENEAAYRELARQGCDQAQGYHICRPVPAAELDHWLESSEALVVR